ncbi:hypothetical protein ZIOFF_024772 [Zingiber officinale]|uniref:Retrotransposon gag domain-containing protein n=1 Tax=Zingiber officinale TaxID=94328 RepID=A0A8J5GSZ5_ZINOF|nr:hypothetical protein ZIOFF_024772 [Zingiber officinale]
MVGGNHEIRERVSLLEALIGDVLEGDVADGNVMEKVAYLEASMEQIWASLMEELMQIRKDYDALHSEMVKVTISSMYLGGDAKLWWRTRMVDDVDAGREKIDTWARLKKELKAQFLPGNNVCDVLGAIVVADALADFHSNKESLETFSPPKFMKNRKERKVKQKKGAASNRRNGRKDYSAAQGNNNLKSQDCFLWNVPHLVRECPKRKNVDANENEGNVEIYAEDASKVMGTVLEQKAYQTEHLDSARQLSKLKSCRRQTWQMFKAWHARKACQAKRRRGAPSFTGERLGKPASVSWVQAMPSSRLAVHRALSKPKFARGRLGSEASVACMQDMPSSQWSSSMRLSKAQALLEKGLAMIRARPVHGARQSSGYDSTRGVIQAQVMHMADLAMGHARHMDLPMAPKKRIDGLARGAKDTESWAEHLVCMLWREAKKRNHG